VYILSSDKEVVMKTNQNRWDSKLTVVVAVAAATILALASAAPSDAQDRIPAAEVVWQHVGRIYLNPSTGKAVYAGYVVHLTGVSASLFNGSPSEATAYFTFSTDVLSLTPIGTNGEAALFLVSAGTFKVYYNPTPDGDWSNPGTFSSGHLIATFARKESLFPLFTNVGVHSLSETLESSQAFTFGGEAFDVRRMVPNGITFASFFGTKPLITGLTDYPVAFSAAGTTMAVGGGQSDKGNP
jgi:hypothetical protein